MYPDIANKQATSFTWGHLSNQWSQPAWVRLSKYNIVHGVVTYTNENTPIFGQTASHEAWRTKTT